MLFFFPQTDIYVFCDANLRIRWEIEDARIIVCVDNKYY